MSRVGRNARHNGSVLIALCLIVSMLGCQSTPSSRQSEDSASRETSGSRNASDPLSDSAWLSDPSLDGVFVVPGTDFSGYLGLLIPAIDLSQWRPVGQELPLRALNRNDREFIQTTYSQTLVHSLVMEGEYSLAMDPGPEVLEVRANLRQGIQAADGQRDPLRPRGTVMMLLTLDLHDSQTGELVATMSRRQPIDRSMNERNSPLTSMQIQRAFIEWMSWFRTELDALRAGS
ncbi:hypothetical protein [Marinimicrobium sp. ARAG 43.8]|uniref:hypothetical protein n=1 Tax=Marinimicrobium sp. ARAG 43.8 TaxID=3418719 RepID=UPI003CEF93A6